MRSCLFVKKDRIKIIYCSYINVFMHCNIFAVRRYLGNTMHYNYNCTTIAIRYSVFEDMTVEANKEYTYTITAVLSASHGAPSKPFRYVHNQEFCGNGELNG